jgi:uncharacterized protein YjbJ (UPF0337 family)
MDEKRVTGEVKKVAGQVEGAVGDLTGDRETKAEGQATELKGTVENLVGQAKDVASQITGQAAGLAQDALKQGRERIPGADEVYRRGNEAVRGYASSTPIGTILVALGAGYLLGLLIHGRD